MRLRILIAAGCLLTLSMLAGCAPKEGDDPGTKAWKGPGAAANGAPSTTVNQGVKDSGGKAGPDGK